MSTAGAFFGLLVAATLSTACSSSTAKTTTGPGDAGKDASSKPVSDASETADAAGLDFPITEVKVGAFTFNVRTAGPTTGEAVLLLHGFPESSYEWRYQMKALADKGYYAIAPDQRGYSPGARPPDVASYALLNLIGDALGIVAALGVNKFHLVGHDWGAGVAWGIAIAAPSQVLTFTSISIPAPGAFAKVLADKTSCQYPDSAYFETFSEPDAGGAFLFDNAAFLRSTYSSLPADAQAEYVKTLDTPDAMRAALDWYRANTTNRQLTTPVATPVTVPTLLVWGDQDPFICNAGIDITNEYVTAPYSLSVLAGVGHWVPELAAARVTELLLSHFAAQHAD